MTALAEVVHRRLRWWDLDQILPIERQLFPDTSWTAEMFWSELSGVPNSRYYIVSEVAGEVAGYAGVMVIAADADVQTIGVRSEHQGRGIGTALLDDLEREAVRRGASRIFLEVSADNDRAQSLYQHRGYEVSGRRRDYYRPGVDAVLMNKTLVSSTERS